MADARKKAQEFEKNLIASYEAAAGRRLPLETKLELLDALDESARAWMADEATDQQKLLLRVSQYRQHAQAALRGEGPGSSQAISNEITSRREMAPIERMADWDQEARRAFSGRGSRETRTAIDRQSMATANRGIDPEENSRVYPRLAPEDRPPRGRDFGTEFRDVDMTGIEQVLPEEGQHPRTLTARYAERAVPEQIIREAHDPRAGDAPNVAGQMTRENQLADPADRQARTRASFAGKMREPSLAQYLTEQLGAPWDEMPPDERRGAYRDPNVQRLLSQQDRTGHAEAMGPTMREGAGSFDPLPAPRESYMMREGSVERAGGLARGSSIQQGATLKDLGRAAMQALDDGNHRLARQLMSRASEILDQMQDSDPEDLITTTDPQAQANFRGAGGRNTELSGPAIGPGTGLPQTESGSLFDRLMRSIDPNSGGTDDAPYVAPLSPSRDELSSTIEAIGGDPTPPSPAFNSFEQRESRSPVGRLPMEPGQGDPTLTGDRGSPGRMVRPEIRRPGEEVIDAPSRLRATVPAFQYPPGSDLSAPRGHMPGGPPPGLVDDIIGRLSGFGRRVLPGVSHGLGALGVVGNVADLSGMSDFNQFILDQNALGGVEDSSGVRVPVDPGMSNVYSGLGMAIPFLGQMMFDRQKFMRDPAYRDSYLQRPEAVPA